MAKKIAVKRQAWNKGLQVGKRDGFTPAQVKRIRGVLKARGAAGVRDLALLSKSTTMALEKWITAAGLKYTDYLFPGGDPSGSRPLGGRQLTRLLKDWVV